MPRQTPGTSLWTHDISPQLHGAGLQNTDADLQNLGTSPQHANIGCQSTATSFRTRGTTLQSPVPFPVTIPQYKDTVPPGTMGKWR